MHWILWALISAVFSSLAAITQKHILKKISALQFSLIVSFMTAILIAPFLYYINWQLVSMQALIILFGKTILTAGAFLCVMLSLKELPISSALPWMVLTPGFVAIGGYVFLNEEWTLFQWAGLLCFILGTGILEYNAEFKHFWKTNRFIFCALVFFTVSSLLDKIIVVNYHLSPLGFTFFQQLFSFIIFLCLLPFDSYLFKTEQHVKSKIYFDLSILGTIFIIACFTVVYRYTQIAAVKVAPAVALVIAIKRLSVLFSTIFGGKLFQEKQLCKKTFAVCILLLGAYFILK